MNTCLRVLKETKWIPSFYSSWLLLKFIEYFPDYLSALSRTLFLVETAVYTVNPLLTPPPRGGGLIYYKHV